MGKSWKFFGILYNALELFVDSFGILPRFFFLGFFFLENSLRFFEREKKRKSENMTLIAILISIVEYHDDTPVKNYEISSHEIEIKWHVSWLLLYPTHRLLDSLIRRFLWIKFIFAHGFLKLVQFLLVGSIPSPSFPIPTTTVDEIVNLFSHSFPSVISNFNSTLFVQETSSYLHSENLRESANS